MGLCPRTEAGSPAIHGPIESSHHSWRLVVFPLFRRGLRDVKPSAETHTARYWRSHVSSYHPFARVVPVALLACYITPPSGPGFSETGLRWVMVLIRVFILLLGCTVGLLHTGASLSPSPPSALHPPCCQPGPPPSCPSQTPPALLTGPDFNKGNLESITSRIWEI